MTSLHVTTDDPQNSVTYGPIFAKDFRFFRPKNSQSSLDPSRGLKRSRPPPKIGVFVGQVPTNPQAVRKFYYGSIIFGHRRNLFCESEEARK